MSVAPPVRFAAAFALLALLLHGLAPTSASPALEPGAWRTLSLVRDPQSARRVAADFRPDDARPSLAANSVSAGDLDWSTLKKPRKNFLQGYTDKFSYATDEAVLVFLSIQPTASANGMPLSTWTYAEPHPQLRVVRYFLVDAFDERTVVQQGPAGEPHLHVESTECNTERDLAAMEGCNFAPAFQFTLARVPPGAYYLDFAGGLESEYEKGEKYLPRRYIPGKRIFFTVKPPLDQLPASTAQDRERVAILMPSFTWLAYNAYGGPSTYINELLNDKEYKFMPYSSPLRPNLSFHSSKTRFKPSEFMYHHPCAVVLLADTLMEGIDDWDRQRPAEAYLAEVASRQAPPPKFFANEEKRVALQAERRRQQLSSGRVLLLDSFDLHDSDAYLARSGVLVLCVHDEYWSEEQRVHVHRWIERQGGRVLVASGNTMYWKIRLSELPLTASVNFTHDPSASSSASSAARPLTRTVPNRRLVVYKRPNLNKYEHERPMHDPDWTGRWHESPWPQSATLGMGFIGYPVSLKAPADEWDQWRAMSPLSARDPSMLTYFSNRTADLYGDRDVSFALSGGYRVLDPRHPVFASLGLAAGQWLDSTVAAIEVDGLTLVDYAVSKMPGDSRACLIDSRSCFCNQEPSCVLNHRLLDTPHANTPHVVASSFGVMPPRIMRTALIADTDLGLGRVLHLGSIGWFAAIIAPSTNPYATAVLKNSIRYLVGWRAPQPLQVAAGPPAFGSSSASDGLAPLKPLSPVACNVREFAMAHSAASWTNEECAAVQLAVYRFVYHAAPGAALPSSYRMQVHVRGHSSPLLVEYNGFRFSKTCIDGFSCITGYRLDDMAVDSAEQHGDFAILDFGEPLGCFFAKATFDCPVARQVIRK